MLTFLAANMGMTEMELQPALQLANTRRSGEGAVTGNCANEAGNCSRGVAVSAGGAG